MKSHETNTANPVDFPKMEKQRTVILDDFWNTESDAILFFDKTKEECKQCLYEILNEYADLIERMKYV